MLSCTYNVDKGLSLCSHIIGQEQTPSERSLEGRAGEKAKIWRCWIFFFQTCLKFHSKTTAEELFLFQKSCSYCSGRGTIPVSKIQYTHTNATHPDSSDWLRRSHITQYRCGYCKSQYRSGYYEVTLMLLWQKAEKLLHMQQHQSTLIVPSRVLRLAVVTAVLRNMRPT